MKSLLRRAGIAATWLLSHLIRWSNLEACVQTFSTLAFFVRASSDSSDDESAKPNGLPPTENMTLDETLDLSDANLSDDDGDSKVVDHVPETSDSDDDIVGNASESFTKQSKVPSTADDVDDDDAQVTSSSNAFSLAANSFFFHKLLTFKLADDHDLNVSVSFSGD